MTYKYIDITDDVQLIGYKYSSDGFVNDIVYMNDIRQTHLVCCDNAIYAYISRKEQGYTFSKPFASSNYTVKLTRPDYTNTECYALNKAVNCEENTYVFNTKVLYKDLFILYLSSLSNSLVHFNIFIFFFSITAIIIKRRLEYIYSIFCS